MNISLSFCLFPYLLLIFNPLVGQQTFYIENIQSFPQEFATRDFHPTRFQVGVGGHIYYLDQSSCQIAVVSPEGKVRFSGGFGREQDAFFDPIGLSQTHLGVWVSDRTENRLIEYDFRLNFILSEEHSQIYPDYMDVDPWGNLVFYSEQTRAVWRKTDIEFEQLPFVDLNPRLEWASCVEDMAVSLDGDIALLNPCEGQISVFNRLGKPIAIYPYELENARYLVSYKNEWIVVNRSGGIQAINSGDPKFLEGELIILDSVTDGKSLFLLTDKQVIVLHK